MAEHILVVLGNVDWICGIRMSRSEHYYACVSVYYTYMQRAMLWSSDRLMSNKSQKARARAHTQTHGWNGGWLKYRFDKTMPADIDGHSTRIYATNHAQSASDGGRIRFSRINTIQISSVLSQSFNLNSIFPERMHVVHVCCVWLKTNQQKRNPEIYSISRSVTLSYCQSASHISQSIEFIDNRQSYLVVHEIR